MDSHSQRLRGIRATAGVLVLLSFVVVAVSAYLRLSGAGLGCAGWPECYGQALAGTATLHTGAVRILHRAAATLSLLLGFVLLWRCVRPTPIQPVARDATRLLVLMLLLAMVGLWSSDPHRAWASFLNMLGGLGLVALCWRIVARAAPDASALPRDALLAAGIAALALALALGALIGARFAATACMSTPACAGVWWPPAGGWGALDPFATVAVAAGPGDAGGITLHLLHRYCALVAVLLLGAAGVRGLREAGTRGVARWLLALLGVEFLLGSLTVVSGFSLWLAVAHSVTAALLLAAALSLSGARRASTESS